jgi:hypothetical protein
MTKVLFSTSGDGYWSNVQKTVEIVDMQVTYVNDEQDFGELCVYFNTEDWNCDTDGLIYTDSQFIQDLYAFLTAHGLSTDVSYSEQGMQGDTYVSLDITGGFINSWYAKFGELTA